MLKAEKVKTEKIIEHTYCDICGEECATTLSIEDEDNYNYGPDGYRYKEYHYDICSECIKQYLFPFIKKTTGKKPRVTLDEY